MSNTILSNRGPHVAAGGKPIYVLYPRASDFDPTTTARSLSRIIRYSGNYGPYSVAQHATLVSAVVKQLGGTYSQQMAALHHDDSEMVVGDMPNPVKRLCPGFESIERRIQDAVGSRYMVDIHDEMVRKADLMMHHAEVHYLVPQRDKWMFDVEPPNFSLARDLIYPWDADKAMARYLDLHDELDERINIELAKTAKAEASTAGGSN